MCVCVCVCVCVFISHLDGRMTQSRIHAGTPSKERQTDRNRETETERKRSALFKKKKRIIVNTFKDCV